jgi:hypothetical protein
VLEFWQGRRQPPLSPLLTKLSVSHIFCWTPGAAVKAAALSPGSMLPDTHIYSPFPWGEASLNLTFTALSLGRGCPKLTFKALSPGAMVPESNLYSPLPGAMLPEANIYRTFPWGEACPKLTFTGLSPGERRARS